MRSIVSLLLVLVMSSCTQKETKKDYAIISGQISSSEIESFMLISFNGDFKKEIPVSADGVFLDTLLLMDEMPHRLSDGTNNIVLYLERGYNSNITYDIKDVNGSVRFDGDGASINQYYLLKQEKQREVAGVDFEKFYSLKEPNFIKKVDSMHAEVQSVLSAMENIPDYLQEKERRAIDYYRTILLGEYKDFAHGAVTNNPDFKVSESFPDKRLDMSFLDAEDFNYSVMYMSLVHNHYKEKVASIAQKDSIDPNEAFFRVVEEIPVEKIRNAIAFRTAWGSIPYVEDIDPFYERFMSLSTNETHKAEITDAYNRIKKIKPGSYSPTFEAYENHAGGQSSLEDFRGKYVYIDVWASWCAPCIKEIPALKETEEKYRDRNIEFVSISIDAERSYDDWKKMVVDKELVGVQLIADKAWDSEFVQDYQIKGIPRYILIDPEGKIVNAMAPSPSTDALRSTLEDLGL